MSVRIIAAPLLKPRAACWRVCGRSRVATALPLKARRNLPVAPDDSRDAASAQRRRFRWLPGLLFGNRRRANRPGPNFLRVRFWPSSSILLKQPLAAGRNSPANFVAELGCLGGSSLLALLDRCVADHGEITLLCGPQPTGFPEQSRWLSRMSRPVGVSQILPTGENHEQDHTACVGGDGRCHRLLHSHGAAI
jgi:hypothetical protein